MSHLDNMIIIQTSPQCKRFSLVVTGQCLCARSPRERLCPRNKNRSVQRVPTTSVVIPQGTFDNPIFLLEQHIVQLASLCATIALLTLNRIAAQSCFPKTSLPDYFIDQHKKMSWYKCFSTLIKAPYSENRSTVCFMNPLAPRKKGLKHLKQR